MTIIYYLNSHLLNEFPEDAHPLANLEVAAPYEYEGFSGDPESIQRIVQPISA
jgi:hypothetical protein